MKKISNLLLMIYILLLYYLVDANTKLLITMNFGLYLLIYSIFSTSKYIVNKYKKLLIYSIITIFLMGIPLLGLSYLIGGIINIKYLNITNLLCIIFLILNIITKLITEYLNKSKLLNIRNIFILLINIVLIILLKNKYIILYLYISSIIFSLILIILFIIVKHKDKDKDNINYKDINNIIITDKQEVFINIIKSSYIYISIIILYYILTSKYINNDTNILLSNAYFFGMFFINIIYKIIEKYVNITHTDINNYNNLINKILNISLTICIPLMVISYPLSKVIFNSNYNFVFQLIILLFFYIIYDTIIKISINNLSNKKINISLLIGLSVTLLLEVPLINSSYRMGYDLTLGSILSTSTGLMVTIILLTIFIAKKHRINLLNNFANILNIVYTNIIYLLILILLTLIVKVDNHKYYINILVIIFYLIISIIINIIKKKINRK